MIGAVPTLSIRTPEGISFDLRLAGIVPRFLAWSVDVAAIMVINSILIKLSLFFWIISPQGAAVVGVLAYFLLTICYGIYFEWTWRGQTPGKRLCALRVMDINGLRLQFSQVAIRNLLRAVDLLPAFYSVGGFVSLIHPHCQRLGDIAANTIVVRIPKIDRPEFEDFIGNKYNSLRDYPHLEARLRQTVTPAEAALALDAVRRARTLDNETRLEIFEDLAQHFQGIVEFPPEALETIGPEQYIRNVVDSIYRQTKA